MFAPLVSLAAESAQPNEVAYVFAAYGIAISLLAAYAAWTIVRGRRVGRRLPPEDRRWM